MSTNTTRRITRDDGWVALPGLFDQSEFSNLDGLEVRAQALVLHGGRVLYGLYVRENVVEKHSALSLPAA